MAAQVDGAWCDVDVHEVVDDPALNVVLDPVHQVPAAHVEDLDVRQIPAKTKKKDENEFMHQNQCYHDSIYRSSVTQTCCSLFF